MLGKGLETVSSGDQSAKQKSAEMDYSKDSVARELGVKYDKEGSTAANPLWISPSSFDVIDSAYDKIDPKYKVPQSIEVVIKKMMDNAEVKDDKDAIYHIQSLEHSHKLAAITKDAMAKK